MYLSKQKFYFLSSSICNSKYTLIPTVIGDCNLNHLKLTRTNFDALPFVFHQGLIPLI